MKKNLKKIILNMGLLLLVTFLMNGCDLAETESDITQQAKSDITQQAKSDITQQSKSDITQQSKSDITQQNKSELSFKEIEQLAQECSYQVHWYTEDDEFDSGTAFAIDCEELDQKLLLTAFHCVTPDDGRKFTGEDVAGYLIGGDVFYSKTYEYTGAMLKNCFELKDAESWPVYNKDAAAFTLWNDENIKTLKLSDRIPRKHERVYLLANLWDMDEKDIHENCVYKGIVTDVKDGLLEFKIGDKYGIMGSSGGPVVDKYGEVVGMNLAGGKGYSYARMPEGIKEQLKNGVLSEITYMSE